MPIFRSLDLERMLIYQDFFYGKVLFFTQLSYHLMCKLLKKSYVLSSVHIPLINSSMWIWLPYAMYLNYKSNCFLIVPVKICTFFSLQVVVLKYNKSVFSRHTTIFNYKNASKSIRKIGLNWQPTPQTNCLKWPLM